MRRNISSVLMTVLLAVLLSACSSVGSGSRVPPPEFEYQWSDPFESVMPDGETKWIQCITVNDKRKLDIYIEFMNGTQEVTE